MKGNKTWWGLGIVLVCIGVLLLVGYLAVDPGDPPDVALFLGRFHPSLVHLPIGILLVALVLEGCRHTPRFAYLDRAIPLILALGAASAVAAVVAGLFLSLGGGYDAGLLSWHKRLGIGVAVAAALACGLKVRSQQKPSPRWRQGYHMVLAGLLVMLLLGGHLGGSLTHGAGYLTRYLPAPLQRLAGLTPATAQGLSALEDPREAVVFTALIHPILEARCGGCHNPDKREGGLTLDTPEGLLEGGDGGPVLAPGRAEESELVRRILLPPAHDDYMPPEGKPPLTAAEAELIRWWIAQGASFEQTMAEADVTPVVQLILDGLGVPERRTGIFALDVPPPDSNAVAALRDLGVAVLPLAEAEPFLQVRCAPVADRIGDDALLALLPVAQQVAWLDLGRTRVTDEGLRVLAALPHLMRLHLEATGVGDAGLSHLKDLTYLEYLNLYGTHVGDDGLRLVADLPRLRALYLWQTEVTAEGATRLQQARPGLHVNLGWTPDTASPGGKTEP